MAKERITRRLKVYTTRIGINDWAVAVPSQKEALKAWDVRENLFASGAARVVDDPAVIVAALKTPGIPVAVPVHAKAHVTEAKSNVVHLHERRAARAPVEAKKPVVAERRPEPKKLEPKKPERRAPPPLPPDRSRLDTAEQELREFDIEIKVRRKELARRKQELEREMESFETDTDTRRRRLERQVERAREAYERAKGA
jgi:colicin import membrane protein